MSIHHISFMGPAALAVGVATSLADADGVELTSSEQTPATDDQAVHLSLTVLGTPQSVAQAVSAIGSTLPGNASIQLVGQGR